ncbi:hypothetical protein ES708_15071 [subsurface metagenome]
MYVALEDAEEVMAEAVAAIAVAAMVAVIAEVVIAEVVIARAPVLAIHLFQLIRTNAQFNDHKILHNRTRIERCITKMMIFKRIKK